MTGRLWVSAVGLCGLTCLSAPAETKPATAPSSRPATRPSAAEEAAADAKLLAVLTKMDKQTVQALRKKLPKGYRLKPVVEFEYSVGAGGMRPWLVCLTPIGPDRKPDGIARFYDRRGRLIRTVPYTKGRRNGLERKFHVAGYGRAVKVTVIAEVPWKSGKIVGVKKLYHRPNGKLRMTVPYKDGRQHGLCKQYDLPGALEAVIPYRRGRRHGERIDYNTQTGKVRRIIPYVDDIVDGTVREYWDSGKLRKERPVRKDLFHGIEKRYAEDGQLAGVTYWIDDEKVTEAQFRKLYGKKKATKKPGR